MARILFIEDDNLLREVLCRCLTDVGHVVTQAGDGREGLKRFHLDPAELVITDIVMPDQDGLGMITELRKHYPDVPIIAISGASGNASIYLAIAAKLGARRILTKPFTVPELLRTVNEVLAGPA